MSVTGREKVVRLLKVMPILRITCSIQNKLSPPGGKEGVRNCVCPFTLVSVHTRYSNELLSLHGWVGFVGVSMHTKGSETC